MTRTPLSAPESAPYRRENFELGEPVTIRQVAALIGCSVWSVRQRLIPQGLPHFRSGPGSKMVFYRNQVVAWVLARQNQRKGGIRL
jgi:hypothetical protein